MVDNPPPLGGTPLGEGVDYNGLMKYRPTRCRYCSRQADVDVKISRRGICQDCAIVRVQENAQAQIQQSGELYEKWKVNREIGRAEWYAWAEALYGEPPKQFGQASSD